MTIVGGGTRDTMFGIVFTIVASDGIIPIIGIVSIYNWVRNI